MKHCLRTGYQYIAVHVVLFSAMLFLFSAGLSANDGQTGPGDEIITLVLQDEPLSAALKKISTATGYAFDVDERWQNYPVTASLEAVSLHKGLKKILRNTNNIIIYGPDKKIKIVIYDKTKPGDVAARTPDERSFDGRPVRRGRDGDAPVFRKGEAEVEPESDEESAETPETDANDGEKDQTEPEKSGKEGGEAENTDSAGASGGENPEKD